MRHGIPSWDKVDASAEALASSDDARAETPAKDAGTEAEAVTDEIPLHPHRHGRRPVGLIITVAVMSALLILVSSLAAYLWHVSEAWERQVAEITEISYGLGSDVAAARDALTVAEESITLLEDQLSTAKDSVTRLQAENAQWGDDAAFAQEEIAVLEARISDGITVSTSLVRCIEAHDQLLTYLAALDDAEEGDANPSPTAGGASDQVAPEEVESYQQSVSDLCTAARAASQAFQESVTE